MKICDLTQSYTASSGGVRTYIETKKQYISQKTDYSHVLIIPGASNHSFEVNQFSVHTIKSPLVPKCEPYRFIFNLVRVYSILKAEQPDVIELGSGYILPWIAFFYRFRHGCSVVSFYHTDYPTAYLRQFFTKLLGSKAGIWAEKIGQQYVRLVYRKFDATITASHLFREKLRQLKIPRICYLPLGVETDIFNPQNRTNSLRRKLGLSPQSILLLYVGRLDQEKRVHILMEAFQQIPRPHHFHLLLIGDGPMKEQLVKDAANNSRIKILPYEKNRKMLARFFASADIYITAGPHETFGLCVLEAQASGLPVIGVNAGALRERVSPAVGLLGSVDSSSEMTQNILKLSKLNFRKLGKNARWLTEQNYSWERIFTQLFELYERHSLKQKKSQPIFSPYCIKPINQHLRLHHTSEADKYGNRKEKFSLTDQL